VLDRRHRLTTSAGFTTATRRGRRAGTRTLVLHLAVPPVQLGSAEPRVGLVVSKAVGNAVRRNAVKRRLRHLARERLRSLPASAVLVVRALPASAGATYAGLAQDFDAALRRLGIPVGTVNGR
jgi:ribonuclease P protein component